jgi:hypothetical protein
MNPAAYSIASGLPTDALVAAFTDRIGVDLLPVSDAASIARRTPERIGQVIRSHILPAIHISLSGRGAYLIRASDLAGWIAGVHPSPVTIGFGLKEGAPARYMNSERD